MTDIAKGVARVFDAVGFEILENDTDEGFLTSDNPVVFFDPIANENAMQPYQLNRERMDVELMFAITPRFMLWGHSALKGNVGEWGVRFRSLADEAFGGSVPTKSFTFCRTGSCFLATINIKN